MEGNLINVSNQGMSRDLIISKVSENQDSGASTFAYENHNIRITSTNDSTLLAVTNEKGPKFETEIDGTYLGYCKIGKYLVIFATKVEDANDYIYRISYNKDEDRFTLFTLYDGDLGFSVDNPIEAVGWYESEDIQKVYWVDGKNVSRFINVAVDEAYDTAKNHQFDFTAYINDIPKVSIEKDYSLSGLFMAGTIQYFISFYNKYGAETGIVWQSSLNYISNKERGLAPNETANLGFKINISDINTEYNNIRVYSVYTPSYNGAVQAKLVYDGTISEGTSVINITDTNSLESTIDPSIIYYLGGQSFVASTIAEKDGTLFLGDIEISSSSVGNTIKDYLSSTIRQNSINPFDIKGYRTYAESTLIHFDTKDIPAPPIEGEYSHVQQINKPQNIVATFKYGETYRFGIQFMTHQGDWTSVVWIGDKACTIKPSISETSSENNNYYSVANAVFEWGDGVNNIDFSMYSSYRILFAEMTPDTRRILAQGVINPTMFNYTNRYNNNPYSIGSWNFRPRGSGIANRHLQSIGTQYKRYAELQGVTEEILPLLKLDENLTAQTYKYYNVILGIDPGQELSIKLILYNIPESWSEEDMELWCAGNGSKKIPETHYKEFNAHVNASVWEKAITGVYNKIKEDVKEDGFSMPFYEVEMPNKKLCKTVNTWKNKSQTIAAIAIAVTTAAAIAVTAVTWGTAGPAVAVAEAALIGALASALETAATVTLATAITSLAVLGVAGVAGTITEQKNADEAPKQMAGKGFIYAGEQLETEVALENLFNNISNLPTDNTMKGASWWMSGGRVTFKSDDELNAEKNNNQFYVDESVVTLNSPELENNSDLFSNNDGLNLQIIGTIPIQAVHTDSIIDAGKGAGINGSVLSNNGLNSSMLSSDIEGLVSDFLYQDFLPNVQSGVKKYEVDSTVHKYRTYLWNRDTSLSFGNIQNVDIYPAGGTKPIDYHPGNLHHKIFSNIRYSYNTDYFDSLNRWHPVNGISTIQVVNDNNNINIFDRGTTDKLFYTGDYENVVTFIKDNSIDQGYPICADGTFTEDGPISQYKDAKSYDPIHIKYKETPHLLIPFNKYNNLNVILPTLDGETIYDGLTSYRGYSSHLQYIPSWESYKMPSEINCKFIITNRDLNVQTISSREGTYIGDDTYELTGEEYNNFIYDLNATYAKSTLINFVGSNICLFSRASVPSDSGHIKYTVCRLCSVTSNKITFRVLEDIEEDVIYGDVFFTPNNLSIKNERFYKISKDNIIEPYGVFYSMYRDQIEDAISNYPYLYVGEVYKNNFNFGTIYGGKDENALKNLNWLICSDNTNISDNVNITWGDTYYQRWDCLKSYPSTENDTNSIVDILSFMVETHINLDGRYDNNRGTINILNARPSNWNHINRVYSQPNNLLKQSYFDEDMQNRNAFSNQIVWSESKLNASDIDNWTNMTLASSLLLNGSFGKVTKLLNANDSLLAFQDNGISVINYNNNTAIATETGAPLELAKTGKVNGYSILSDTIGCHNKWSIINSAAGVFFIDDYNKKLFKISKEGITDVSSPVYFTQWFKDNISGDVWNPNNNAFKITEDSATGDIYIVNKNTCLVYNYKLQSFISFMDYTECPLFFNFDGKSIVIKDEDNGNHSLYTMFEGEYNNFFGGFKPYSMEFRLNPSPLTDNVFTNFTYIADCIDPSKDLKSISPDSVSLFDNEDRVYKSFDTVIAYNEYQSGELPLEDNKFGIKNLKKKFRIWRGNIPRDGDTVNKHGFAMDRMRNPWIHLKLAKNNPDDSKMIFHNMTVTYYK